jgi:hypothetical protein
MNFARKLIAAAIITILVVVASPGGSPPPAQAVGESTSTVLLSSLLGGLGRGVGAGTAQFAAGWGMSLLGFNSAGGTANLSPQLRQISATLNNILTVQTQLNANLQALNCTEWQTSIVDDIKVITGPWSTYEGLTMNTANGYKNNDPSAFVDLILGPDGRATNMATALKGIYGAVFAPSGGGAIDACLAAAAAANPPPLYQPDNFWYETYVVPFQDNLMLAYTQAMTMVVDAFHQKAFLNARANGMPDGDFTTLATEICSGKYDSTDPASATQPSNYCRDADNFVSRQIDDLRVIVARAGAPYSDDKVVYYTGTDYLLVKEFDLYGLNTVGTYDARMPNGSGFDGYSGTWEAAPSSLFKQLLTGWIDLDSKDTTTAGFWLCRGISQELTQDPIAHNCTGIEGLDDQIVIFPETGKSGKLGDTKYVCFMDGSIPRDKVDGQPFCSDSGFKLLNVFRSSGNCGGHAAYQHHTWTQSLASGDPSFYTLSYDYSNLHEKGGWCAKPGYVDLTVQKLRFPAFAISQIVCAPGYPATNGAGMRTKCGADLVAWLDGIIPLPSANP